MARSQQFLLLSFQGKECIFLFTKGPVALGRIYVYFAKKTVNKCCRRVRPACFALTKFCPTLPNFKEAATKKSASPLGSPIFCQAILWHFFVCVVSQNPLEPFQHANRYVNSKARQTEKYRFCSVQQAFRSLSVPKFRFSAVSRSSCVGSYRNRKGAHLTITAPKFFQARS